MLLSCFCHAFAMLLPCFCHTFTMLLSYLYHASTIPKKYPCVPLLIPVERLKRGSKKEAQKKRLKKRGSKEAVIGGEKPG
jgi:hypothetical protein